MEMQVDKRKKKKETKAEKEARKDAKRVEKKAEKKAKKTERKALRKITNEAFSFTSLSIVFSKIPLVKLFSRIVLVCKHWHKIITDNSFLTSVVTLQVVKKATINKQLYTAAKLQELGPYQFWRAYVARDLERQVMEGNLGLVAMYLGSSGYFTRQTGIQKLYNTKELLAQFSLETKSQLSIYDAFPNIRTNIDWRSEMEKKLTKVVAFVIGKLEIFTYKVHKLVGVPESDLRIACMNYTTPREAARNVVGRAPRTWHCSYEYPKRLRCAWAHISEVLAIITRCKRDSIDNKTKGKLYRFTVDGPTNNAFFVAMNRDFTILFGGHRC